MKLYLACRPTNQYVLTWFKPIKFKVAGTERYDIYIEPGDPIGISKTDFCRFVMEFFKIKDLKPFEYIEVEFNGKAISEIGTL